MNRAQALLKDMQIEHMQAINTMLAVRDLDGKNRQRKMIPAL